MNRLFCVPFGVPFTALMHALTLLLHVFEGTDTQFVPF